MPLLLEIGGDNKESLGSYCIREYREDGGTRVRALVFFLVGFFFVRMFRRLRLFTVIDFFENRYGKTAAGIYSAIFKKVYDVESVEVSPNAIAQTSLGRM